MFFTIRFTLLWLIWLLFADKKRWREILPVSIFAGFLGSLTDTAMQFYPLWGYQPRQAFTEISDDLGVYIVVTYLFIQWLPKKQTCRELFKYIFIWSGIALALEWYHIHTGYMKYYQWWNMGWSYLADWFLFWVFYKFYKILNLYKLSPGKFSLESALNSQDDIAYVLNREGRLVESYSRYLERYGILRSNCIGKTPLEIVGGNDNIHNIAQEKALNGENFVYEWTWLLPGCEKPHYFQTSVSPLRDSGGEIIGVFGIGREITQFRCHHETKSPTGTLQPV